MITADDHSLRLALEHGLLQREQAEAAQARSEGRGVVEVLAEEGVLDAGALARIVAAEFDFEYLDLARVVPTPAALALVPREVALRFQAVPISLDHGRLRVALKDPLDVTVVDALSHLAGHPVDPAVATSADIRRALARHHDWDDAGAGTSPAPAGDAAGSVSADDAPIIRLVHDIILGAVRRRASDIHLEPLEHRFRVRYRVDGVLQEAESPPKRMQAAIVSRVKIMANISIAEKRVPQDGRIQFDAEGRALDLRVATLPTAHGESVVLRLLDRDGLARGLAELGLWDDDRALFERNVTAPDGLVLVTGPTGSGKTTSLYAALHQLNGRDRKLITVEDPVEYQIPGINQVPVNPATGMTFAAALRALLRQAPNVAMVGEIRDGETADIALNAALTGHLVLSTLHTNDAPGAVTRLLDIGVKPFLAAAALRLVVAQRLVRRICVHCCEPHTPGPAELARLGVEQEQAARAEFARGTGCPACSGTGYRGRLGLFEMLVIDDELQALIYEPVTAARLRAAARRAGMRTMREDGLRKVLAGLTTIEEVAAATADETASP